MDNGTYNGKSPSANIKSRMKSMYNLMLDYAVEYELVDRNYARTFKVSEEIREEINNNRVAHTIYSNQDLEKLWDHAGMPIVNMILVQCYMGWRPQELCRIKLDDVNIKDRYIVGGMKTAAGKNRYVPIHDEIIDICSSMFALAKAIGSEYLFCDTDGSMLTYDKYRHRFEDVISNIGIVEQHRPHDGRKQFITLAKSYNVDEYAIKMMVGHAIDDITEKIYTDRPKQWLHDEMKKIKKYNPCS